MSDQQPDSHSAPCPPPVYEEDEISLLDLFLVVLKYKWLLFFTVAVAGLLAVAVSLRMTNIYQSSATITPEQVEKAPKISSLTGFGIMEDFLGTGGGGNISKLEVVLQSRDLSRRIIEKYDLLPRLFPKKWNADQEQWKQEDEQPTVQDGIRRLQESMLDVSSDRKKNIIKVGFNHPDPAFARQMVARYLTELSESLRETTLRDAEEKTEYLQEELNHTSDVLLKEKISALLASEVEKMTFAKVQKYYTFEVIDPPLVPDLNKKVKPKRARICILTVVVAFFLAVFLAFFLEFLRKVRKNASPEQRLQLDRYLGGKK
jgi:uncharacterized protein involved in exopolysaccharide biosynthesis